MTIKNTVADYLIGVMQDAKNMAITDDNPQYSTAARLRDGIAMAKSMMATPDEPAGEWRVDEKYVYYIEEGQEGQRVVAVCPYEKYALQIARDHNRKYAPDDVEALIKHAAYYVNLIESNKGCGIESDDRVETGLAKTLASFKADLAKLEGGAE